MSDPRKAPLIAAAATIIGWDLGSNDTTVFWQAKQKAEKKPNKRAKVKAARKQRNRKWP